MRKDIKMTPYTAIPNSLLERLYTKEFTGSEVKMILLVLRYTIGFKCDSSPFSVDFISEKTQMDKRSIRKTVNSLISKKAIAIMKNFFSNTPRSFALALNSGEGKNVPSGEGKNVPSGEGKNVPHINKTINKTIKSECERVAELFNELCVSFPKVTVVSRATEEKIERLLSEFHERDIREGFKIAERSEFLKGKKNGWRASFDWLIEGKNLEKVLRGAYGGEESTEDSFDIDDFFRVALERDMKR